MKEISRREFLKLGAILAGGALLSGCLPENSQASLPPQGETPKEPTPTPTKTNTPEAAKTLTPTKVPTPAPTERPTLSPEELTKERMARWEGRLWTIGSSDSAGGREIDPYDEEMQIFKEEVTLMAEKSGVKAEAVEMLLIGNNADIKERKDGTIEQIAPTKFFGIMISGKEEASVFCFTKDASGMEMDSSCDWFKKGEIWGSEYGEYIVKSPEGTALESLIIREGQGLTVFKAVADQFGVLSVKEQEVKGELEKDENGEWVLEGEVKDKEREEAVTGILITGENNGEIGTFFLECKTLPLDRKLKAGIFPETPDLALGRIYLSQEGIRYGYLDLKDGTWNGNEGYEDVNSLLREERPAWVINVSNAEAKYNQEQNIWEYFSTVTGERVVSVRQNAQGEFEFYNYAERVKPQLHPELFRRSTWTEIAARMTETGVVKALFVDVDKVSELQVYRFPDSGNLPLALVCILDSPADIYYPFLKSSQASPSTPRILLYLFDVNPDIMAPIDLTVFSEVGKARVIEDDENFTGETGIMAGLGTKLLHLKGGAVSLTGRKNYDNPFNRMGLDSFARDKNGRLMVPGTVAPSK